jgi:GT2 family glycosyltransferase
MISIQIVTYNSEPYIRKCLESILFQKNVEFEVLIYDNFSEDGTLKVLSEFEDNRINIINGSLNVGFGRAHNFLSKKAQWEFLYILNPDCYFEDPSFLEKLSAQVQLSSDVGLWGTAVLEGENYALPSYSYPGENRIKNSIDGLPGTISWVIGASMIIRRKIFEELHGFDEDYFLFSEETDLCLRLRQLGFRINYLPFLEVKHVGSASSNGTGFYKKWRLMTEGLYLFYKKHYTRNDTIMLIKRDRNRAIFRSLILKLQSRNQEKRDKYNAILDVSREQLKDLRFLNNCSIGKND